jgi:hypothetical protein
MPERSASATASAVQDSRPLQVAARVGYAVNGLLHLLIGGIAVGVAAGGGGEADQGGALARLAEAPLGVALLWVVVVGMCGLGLFQLLETVLVRGSDRDAWTERAKEAGKAVAYLAIGSTALRYALGSGSDSSEQTQSLSAQVLAVPGGVVLLLLVAAGVAAVGVYFVVKGVRRRFREDITLPPGAAGTWLERAGVAGYAAKGVAVTVVGVLFAVAALTADPEEATGLDGALHALAALPLGPVVLGAVALGLVIYGLYCVARARYARL